MRADVAGAEQLHRVSEGGADAHRVAQPVHLVCGVGEAQGAAVVEGDGLAGLALDAPIELDSVARHAPEHVAGGGVGDLAGRVPGRAGAQFGFLQQDHVHPSLAGEVVGERAPEDAAADDDDAGVIGQWVDLRGRLRERRRMWTGGRRRVRIAPPPPRSGPEHDRGRGRAARRGGTARAGERRIPAGPAHRQPGGRGRRRTLRRGAVRLAGRGASGIVPASGRGSRALCDSMLESGHDDERPRTQSRDHLVRVFGSATPSTRMSSTTSLKKHMRDAMRGHSAIGRG